MNGLEKTVEDYAAQIQVNWQKMVSTILDTAAICDRANRNLSKANKKLLLEKLPFSPPVFSMLAQVGHDPRFRQNGMVELLPPSYSTLYLLTQFETEELESVIKAGVLNKNATRSELNIWLRGAHKKKGGISLPKGFYAGIRFKQQPTLALLNKVDELLAPISGEEGVEIIRHKARADPAMQRYHQKIFAFVKRQLGDRVKAKQKREPSSNLYLAEEMNVSIATDFEDLEKIARLVEESEDGGAALMHEVLAMANRVIPLPDVSPSSDPFAPAPPTAAEEAAELEEVAKSLPRRRRGTVGPLDKAAFDIFK